MFEGTLLIRFSQVKADFFYRQDLVKLQTLRQKWKIVFEGHFTYLGRESKNFFYMEKNVPLRDSRMVSFI